ncbi:VCBS domain-containing protein [Bradyrhizobium sp. CCGB20]|uniref:VCBS domain-containing protein n=1 Tax=Bradyrhizobium sp. CCGB20 TaxID=2949633 RepID=UPI0020B1E9D6|nr:VCBS domain-containing protein [Bradyrhizobium sp. CCGB20]MCP3402320.1 VCBS domain-containing protein [Bradyrhizobium sp. CCGB20]
MFIASGVAPHAAIAALPLQIIGMVRTAFGHATLTRDSGAATRVSVGDLVCRGDVIETAADAQIGIRLLDDTVFNVSSCARIELREFTCDSDGASRSTVLAVASGNFAFAAGRLANSGTLTIDTPMGSVRSRSHASGFGLLTIAALTFSMMKDAQAADPDTTFLDDDRITYKDLQHGAFELITKEAVPRHIIVDDPGETIVLHRIGSSVSMNQVANSAARMEELQAAQQDVLANLTRGATGSSTPPFADSLPLEHINFTFEDRIVPLGSSTPEPVFVTPLIVRPPPTLGVSAGPVEIDTITFDEFTATTGTFAASSAFNATLTYGISGGTVGNTVLNGRTYDLSQAGPYGTLYLNSTSGAYAFVPNSAAINALQSPTSTSFVITVSDGGLSASQTFTIAINGVNDTAAISGNASGGVVEAGGTANAAPGTPTATGTLTDTDVDNPPNTFTAISSLTKSTGGYGSFTMTANGVWTYILDDHNSTVQALRVGDTLTDTLTVTTIDGTPQVVTITIRGSNDAAVISGTSTGSVVEAGGASPGMPIAAGTLVATDVDDPFSTFVAVGAPTASAHGYGCFTITAAGEWTYKLDNANAAVQALNKADTLTDCFTVTTTDGTAQVVTITINGSNDAAVICGTTTGWVLEAGCVANGKPGKPTATGTLTDADPDDPSNTFTPVSTPKTSAGGFGTFTMTALGTWTYTLDNNNSAVQALNDCDTRTDHFTVTTLDGTPQVVTITIKGMNDAAIISGTTTGSVLEAGGISSGIPCATGKLADTDVDNPANTFTAVTSCTASDGGYGTFTMTASGVWTYVLDNNNCVVDALDIGDTLTDHFTVTTIDGTAQEVTICIRGASEADPNDFDNLATGATVVCDPPFVYGTPGDDCIAGGGNFPQTVYGGAGDDTLNGTGVNDTIFGGSGNDAIKGNNGDDVIYGGSGRDNIDGCNGCDTIIGGLGSDRLTGGNGDDNFVYLSTADSRADRFDTITDFKSGADKIDLTAIGALGFLILALTSTSTFVPAHTIAWIYDGSANETVVYVNPTDRTLHIGDSGLLEVHLQGVATIDSSDFIVDQTAALAPALSDTIGPTAAMQGDTAVVAISTSEVSADTTDGNSPPSSSGGSTAPSVDVGHHLDAAQDRSSVSEATTSSTSSQAATPSTLSDPATVSPSMDSFRFVFEQTATSESTHSSGTGAGGMPQESHPVPDVAPTMASAADTGSAVDAVPEITLDNGDGAHSSSPQANEHRHTPTGEPSRPHSQFHSAADDAHGHWQENPHGLGHSFHFLNPAIERSGIAFENDVPAPLDHHERPAKADGHGDAALAAELSQLHHNAHLVDGSVGSHVHHDLIV